MMDSLIPLLFAAVVGFSHAFEADHLLAVSNIVTKRNAFWPAIKDGIAWGLGHTSTIFIVGFLMIALKISISEQVFHYLEAAVGLMLIVLGLFRLYYFQKYGIANDRHFHPEDLFFWKKKKQPGRNMAPFKAQTGGVPNLQAVQLQLTPAPKDHRLAYGVGLIHGLAGSGTLVVIVMSQMQRAEYAMIYLLIFGVGSIAGMLLASGIFSLPFSKKISQNTLLATALTVVSSLLCIGYGAWVIAENLQV
jgi:high-affinity nickel permease